ncbi:MAG: hypothetical protein GAK40_01542 [Burkholderia plantarii]|nr:MAG: hypothetical protein GAK40_01542 [Burkholderia plantarii]
MAKSGHYNLAVTTSNNEKELPDAFLRRCFFHYIQFPDPSTMQRIIEVHYPGIKQALVSAALESFFELRGVAGLKKKPSTSELLDWLKLLLAEDIPPEVLRSPDRQLAVPPLARALLKNEQDLSLFERLVQMNRHHRLATAQPRPGTPPHATPACSLPVRPSGHAVPGVCAGGPEPRMLIDFFYSLRAAKLPVSVKEYLTLLEALREQVIPPSIDAFYYLARMTLVKDETHFDRFDRAFGAYFHGVATLPLEAFEIPSDWLDKKLQRELSAEEKAQIEALGGLDKLMERLRELFDEQKSRHEGGNKWIGTGGTSPFGQGGYHPEGIRIGGPSAGNRTAVKVWEARAYRDYDDSVEIGTRNIKVALRRLRRFAREGAADVLDLPGTIRSTAANAGWLDLRMVPERHNAVKVLMLLDVGGSMDDHIRRTEELFSAAKTEFKHLDFYYFHNCVYDFLWKHNRRRHAERTPTWDVLRRFTPDTKLIFVGDATMSPYEVLQPGGSVEYNNPEAGAVWLRRLADQFPHHVWLNPEPERLWEYRQSIAIIHELLGARMYPLTLAGLETAMRELSK